MSRPPWPMRPQPALPYLVSLGVHLLLLVTALRSPVVPSADLRSLDRMALLLRVEEVDPAPPMPRPVVVMEEAADDDDEVARAGGEAAAPAAVPADPPPRPDVALPPADPPATPEPPPPARVAQRPAPTPAPAPALPPPQAPTEPDPARADAPPPPAPTPDPGPVDPGTALASASPSLPRAGGPAGNGPAASTGNARQATGEGGQAGQGVGMGDHPDAEALIARWARRLDRIVARAQIYPRDAQRTGQQGMVMLEVRIDASGRILSVEVRRSSGHPLLDEAAIASLQSLGSLPAPPGEVRWDGRPIQIPIHYRL